MAELKILIEGYAKKLEHGWVASSSVCLVITGDTKIITDPGCNRAKLLQALNKENLETRDIDYVFISHAHPDHSLLAGAFENANIVTWDSELMYDNDQINEYTENSLGPDIKILQTPGHMLEHTSLVVDTKKGKIGIAGDLIFWLEDEEQEFRIDQPDRSETKGFDMKMIIESRKELVERCDYIVPGHGKMFKVKK